MEISTAQTPAAPTGALRDALLHMHDRVDSLRGYL